MKYLLKSSLSSGGIIPNYICSAACRHCVYASSPRYPREYISEKMASHICRELQVLDCYSVHIGGGEPFLDFDGLLLLAETIKKSGLVLEYIETNASWCTNNEKSAEKIKALLDKGVKTLLISVDPYHIEFVPLEKPLRLIELCQNTGMRFFVWRQEYLNQFIKNEKIELDKKYSREELEKILGKEYILETAQSYGLSYNGRALCILREYGNPTATNKLLQSGPCRELANTGHFHVDLYGNYIAPGCSGIGVPLHKLTDGIEEDEYLVANKLYHEGIGGLFELALKYGFTPAESYYGKCDLCINIRAFLSEKSDSDSSVKFAELCPKAYYREYLTH